jgi:hypothetical protein
VNGSDTGIPKIEVAMAEGPAAVTPPCALKFDITTRRSYWGSSSVQKERFARSPQYEAIAARTGSLVSAHVNLSTNRSPFR